MGGPSGGGGTTTTVQKADPWSGVQSYLRGGYSDATDLYNQGGPQYFEGQTYVNRDPLENAAMSGRLGYAANQMPAQIADAQSAQSSMLNAPDVANNPYIGGLLDVTQDRLNRNLTENLLPSIRGGAMVNGGVGSSRQGIAEGLALRGTQDALAASNAQIMSDAYGQGLDQQYRGMVLAPQTFGLGLEPFNVVGEAGAYNRGEQELALQSEMDRYNYNQQAPYANLNNYMSLLQGAPWGSTSVANMAGGGRSGFSGSGALGGGLLGYSAAPAIASAFAPAGMSLASAALGPVGIAGALAGAAFGGLF